MTDVTQDDGGRSTGAPRVGIGTATSCSTRCIELFTEDQLAPNAADVAARSGVSLRSVYRYFEDLDALVRAAIARHAERVAPLLERPRPRRGLVRRPGARASSCGGSGSTKPRHRPRGPRPAARTDEPAPARADGAGPRRPCARRPTAMFAPELAAMTHRATPGGARRRRHAAAVRERRAPAGPPRLLPRPDHRHPPPQPSPPSSPPDPPTPLVLASFSSPMRRRNDAKIRGGAGGVGQAQPPA